MEAAGGEAEIRRKYAALGYELLLPEHVLRLSREELKRVAVGATFVLDEVYHRRLELSTERTLQLIDDVISGQVNLFVLRDRDRSIVATMAFDKLEPIFGDARVSSYEAGRVAKRVGSPPRLATDLIRAAFIWAAGHLDGDYVVAEARVARPEEGRPYNGRMLARVLRNQNFVPTHAVYSHYVAQTKAEPFVWACGAINPETWRKTVQEQRIRLPDSAESQMFAAMLAESISVHVAYDRPAGSAGTLRGEIRELVGPSPIDESLYVLTNHTLPSRRVLREVPGIKRSDGAQASAGLSDRLIVEEDIVVRPDAPQVLNVLYQAGFTLAGWAPSHRRFGRLALVLTRPGTVPADRVSVAPPDLSMLEHLPATRSFLTRVLSRRPSPKPRDVTQVAGREAVLAKGLAAVQMASRSAPSMPRQ